MIKESDLVHDQHSRGIASNNNCQMIVITGVLIVISIVILGSLAAEIADIDMIVSNERSTSLLAEYIMFEESFGVSLQTNLTNITVSNLTSISGSYRSFYYGFSDNITNAVLNTRNRFHNIALRYDLILDATLNRYWYSHPANNGDIYYVDVTLTLGDGLSSITRDVTYTVVLRPYIDYGV
jgi:hypothetical protein